MVTFAAQTAFDTADFVASGLLFEVFTFGEIIDSTDAAFVLEYSDEAKTITLMLVGSLTDYVDGYPTAGVITDISFTLNGSPLFTFAGLSMQVEQFTSLVRANDVPTLFQLWLVGGDQVDGSGGSDVLLGHDGSDAISGGPGSDQLSGGGGNDFLDGGDGIDTAIYSGLFRSYDVQVSGASGSVAGGPAGGTDTLASIERIQFRDGKFVFDADGVAAQVARLYDATLQRAPDQAGLDLWVDYLEDQGATLKDVANGFLGSAEFQARTGNLSNADYVEFLYQNALRRASDPDGKAGWIQYLESGGGDRADLLIGFSESTEHRGLTADLVARGFFNTDDAYQAVALLYDSFAGRLPDEQGLIGWAEALKSGATLSQVAEGFANSAEFQNLTAGMSHDELVEFMYRNTLDRGSEPGERAGWVNALDAGMSDADLLIGFSQSFEHFYLLGNHITNGVDYL